jgi:segregation and condensation protein A
VLLPRHSDEEDEEDDPRMDLVASLMEYARIKEAAVVLGGRNLLGRDVFGRGLFTRERAREEPEFEAGLFELTAAFVELLRRAETAPPMEVEVDALTLRKKMVELLAKVKEQAQAGLTFQALIEELKTRMEAVLTFLAVLELMRLGAVKAFQHEASAIIRIFPGPRAWLPLPLVEELEGAG